MTVAEPTREPAKPASAPGPGTSDPLALVRTRSYVALLVLAAILGVPISAAAFWFLKLVDSLQKWIFTDLPAALGFQAEPTWWPLPMLVAGGLLVALIIRFLPGQGGHSPAEGFKAHGAAPARELPGILLAALATLGFGAVLGPEAPLIALGGGLAVWAVSLIRRDMPERATAVVGAAGSFAAVSTLLGSPILGAFLLMEASGLGGPTLAVVMLPGLLAAGIGALVFVGLDNWTGFGTFSLAIPDLPSYGQPRVSEFGWAIVIGVAAVLVGSAIRRLALFLQPYIERHRMLLTPVTGAVIAGLAILYAETTGKKSAEVLFSGQTALGPLITGGAAYSVGALLLLILCKSLAYSTSLSSFRGGPIFPAMFLGAAGGIALSHLPGLSLVAGVAMGMGAMCTVMLSLPMTAVLLATLLLFADGLAVMPLVIVSVVVAYVVSTRLSPTGGAGGRSRRAGSG
jgi:H+/Cl- antiporter ClcA